MANRILAADARAVNAMTTRLPQLLQSLVVASALTQAANAQQQGFRAPLLPSGGYLTRVQGTLEPGAGGRAWTYRLRDAFEGESDRNIMLLPSNVLEDMIRRHDSLPSGEVAKFELSAVITTYRGENAALPLFATPIQEFAQRMSRPVMRPPGAMGGSGAIDEEIPQDMAPIGVFDDLAEQPAFGMQWSPVLPSARLARVQPATGGGEVQADEIERQLVDAVGDVQRSMDMTQAAVQAEMAAMTDAAPSGGNDPLRNRPWLESDRMIQDRLGVVTRDPISGEWRFIFESSRGELGEREATLLPSPILEGLETAARSTIDPLTVVISGQVTRFQGRAYLLPNSYKPLKTGKLLSR